MTEHGLFTDEGLVAALRRCAWGIAVMDPAGEDLQFSRFSFPNKVGTYLSSRRAGAGLRPSDQQPRPHHAGAPAGQFTSATARGDLEKFLLECLRLPSPRAAFRDDILRSARTEFNAAEMRARLWRTWGVKLAH